MLVSGGTPLSNQFFLLEAFTTILLIFLLFSYMFARLVEGINPFLLYFVWTITYFSYDYDVFWRTGLNFWIVFSWFHNIKYYICLILSLYFFLHILHWSSYGFATLCPYSIFMLCICFFKQHFFHSYNSYSIILCDQGIVATIFPSSRSFVAVIRKLELCVFMIAIIIS